MDSGEINLHLIEGFFAGIKPVPLLTVSQWADTFRYLDSKASAEPGLWRTSRTPYLRAIMDDLSSLSPVQEVVVIKGAQLGFTEAGNNWIGYIIDISPAPTMMVQPTEETVKRNAKVRINPMIAATPNLKDKVGNGNGKSKDSGDTIYYKEFPGGVLVMTWSNSGAGLRSMPVRFLFLDEVDGYEQDIDGEGSPLDLARARTRTFARRKILIGSTPTTQGVSNIEIEFATTDQRYYNVPCPFCGTMQPLIWERVKWEKGNPYSAKYQCSDCNEFIEERYKTTMLENGSWEATIIENINPKRVGYYINSLYSPLGWFSWGDAADMWEKAQNDTNKLKTFVNTVLGQVWVEKGEAPPWETVYNRREEYKTNAPSSEVAFLTAGVDVQKDRLEVEIVGWCKGKTTYSIDYRVLQGDTSLVEVWDELAKVVNEVWVRADGIEMPLRLMAIDTGYNTDKVYTFCRRYDATKVIAVKGQDKLNQAFGPPAKVDRTKDGKKVGKATLYPVGVSFLKTELYGWLKSEIKETGEIPPGYCHFPQYGPTYFRGLTAEQLEYKKNKAGYRVYQWVKKYDRNEPLDCRVYARAAAAVVGIDRFNDEYYNKVAHVMQKRALDQKDNENKPKEPVKRNKTPKPGSFWDK